MGEYNRNVTASDIADIADVAIENMNRNGTEMQMVLNTIYDFSEELM